MTGPGGRSAATGGMTAACGGRGYWQQRADVVVIGTGVAGLVAALKLPMATVCGLGSNVCSAPAAAPIVHSIPAAAAISAEVLPGVIEVPSRCPQRGGNAAGLSVDQFSFRPIARNTGVHRAMS